MNPAQLAKAAGANINDAVASAAYNHWSIAIFRSAVVAAMTIAGFFLTHFYEDTNSKLDRALMQTAILTQTVSDIPQKIDSATADRFTGTDGKVLEQKVERLGDKIDRNSSDIRDNKQAIETLRARN